MNDKLKTLTPKLRFPEFRDAPGWRRQLLEDFFTERQEVGRTDLPLLSLMDKEGVIPQAGTNRRDNSSLDKSRYLRVVPGDVAYNTMRMWEGRSAYVGLEGLVSPAYTVCKPKADIHGLFFSYYFKTWPLIKQFTRYAQGLVKDTLNLKFEAFAQIPISAPQPAEQRKVAACLTSLDEWIAAEERKLQALRAHKKGLMRQLFPREGESLPHLRFPEFRDGPEWEATVGGKLFINRNEDGEEGLPIYSVTVNEGMVPRASFDRDFYDIEDPAGNKKVCKGDIAYNMMRMWQGAQGVAVEDCMVSPAYVVLVPLEGVYSEFFAYLFKLPQSLRVLTSHSRGLTLDRLRLYFDDFKRVPLRVPKFPEQQRIAICLSSLDGVIATQSRKLDGLRAHKKGLMQQLFPSPEGV